MFTGIAAVATAASAGGVAAVAALSATVVLAAVAEVGLILTVVGAVTGSETLMKVGGVLGLVGGVGGLIAGAAEGAAGAAVSSATDATTDSILEQSVMETTNAAATAGTSAATEAAQAAAPQFAETQAFEAAFQPTAAAPAYTAPVTQSTVAGTDLLPIDQSSIATAARATPDNVGIDKALGSGMDSFDAANGIQQSTAEVAQANLNRAGTVYNQAGQGVTAPITPVDRGIGVSNILNADGSAATGAAATSDSMFGKLWGSLGKEGQNSVIKIGADMVKGAAGSSKADREYELNRQLVQRNSFGSAVPLGIIGRAARTQ